MGAEWQCFGRPCDVETIPFVPAVFLHVEKLSVEEVAQSNAGLGGTSL